MAIPQTTAKYSFQYFLNDSVTPSEWVENIKNNAVKMDSIVTNIVSGTLGETVVAYEVVYFKSDGKWWKAQSGSLTSLLCGIAVEAGDADAEVNISRQGYVTNSGWAWTIGDNVYLSGSTAGALTTTPTDVLLGVATDTDELFLTGVGTAMSDGADLWGDSSYLAYAANAYAGIDRTQNADPTDLTNASTSSLIKVSAPVKVKQASTFTHALAEWHYAAGIYIEQSGASMTNQYAGYPGIFVNTTITGACQDACAVAYSCLLQYNGVSMAETTPITSWIMVNGSGSMRAEGIETFIDVDACGAGSKGNFAWMRADVETANWSQYGYIASNMDNGVSFKDAFVITGNFDRGIYFAPSSHAFASGQTCQIATCAIDLRELNGIATGIAIGLKQDHAIVFDGALGATCKVGYASASSSWVVMMGGATKFAVATTGAGVTGDFTIQSGHLNVGSNELVCLDGGVGANYFKYDASDSFDFYLGSTLRFSMSTTGAGCTGNFTVSSGNINMTSGKYLCLDSTTNNAIYNSGSNVYVVAGGTASLSVLSSGVNITGNLGVASGSYLTLDRSGTPTSTRIWLSTTTLRIDSIGTIYFTKAGTEFGHFALVAADYRLTVIGTIYCKTSYQVSYATVSTRTAQALYVAASSGGSPTRQLKSVPLYFNGTLLNVLVVEV